jgi:serine/threonine-protein kinase
MRIFSDLAVAQETGLLRFEFGGNAKEVYLVSGAPESVNSSLPSDRFGEYLVGKGALSAAELEKALGMLPQYAGKLGDTLVGLGMLKPLDVFRWLSQQVRDRVIDVFAWTDGTFAFFRGVTNAQESFPLGLDTFEILGAGVLNLPYELLESRFTSLLDCQVSSSERPRIPPESFRLGPTPAEVLEMLDGQRTLRAWMSHFTAPEELLTFLRALYLLSETDLARFD